MDCYNTGKRMLIATARPPRSVRDFLPGELLEIASCVYYNGAYVIDQGEGIEDHIPIPNQVSSEIMDYGLVHMPRCRISVESMDRWFSNSEEPDAAFYNTTFRPQLLSGEELKTIEATKVLITGFDDAEPLRSLFGNRANIVLTDGGKLVQIMNKHVSKQSGIMRLCNHYGVSSSEIIVFGDDYNDIELFRMAGYSVAMQNGVPELKDMANEIADTNDNDGVAKVLERIFKEMG